MKAVIRLATASPARIAAGILARLAGKGPAEGESPAAVSTEAGRAGFQAPDRLEIEGRAAWVSRTYEAALAALDLPPRLTVEAALEGLPEVLDPVPEALETRLFAYGRIAAARHAPKARFEVFLGPVGQLVSAWLPDGLAAIKKAMAADLGTPGALAGLRIPLGLGDSYLRLDLAERMVRLEARDTAALEAVELAEAAIRDDPVFQAARKTFDEASANPSEAAERERREVETANTGRRTGHLLARAGSEVAAAVARLGVGRVRAYLEGPAQPPLPFPVRAEALAAIASPGRARAIVRLILDAREEPGFDHGPWLARLGEEPAPAASAGYEDLILAGVEVDGLAKRLAALDPARSAKALARAALEAEGLVRAQAVEALVALGTEAAAEALDPPPTFRPGLEACWDAVVRLMPTGGKKTAALVAKIQQQVERLAEADPAARYLAARIAEARGDREGAAKGYALAAEKAKEPGLAARARLGAATLSFEAGDIDQAVANLVRLAGESPEPERALGLERLAVCFQRLGHPDYAAALGPGSTLALAARLELVEAWRAARAGRHAEAVTRGLALDAVLPLAGEPARSLAQSLRVLGREAEAIGVLTRACERKADDAETWYQLACLHHEAGRDEASGPPLEGALAADPAFPRALHLKGLLCEKRNELEAAAGLIARALEGDRRLAPAYGDLARVQTSRKLFKDAVQVYQKALASGSANPLPIYRELGALCETHLGDPEQAVYWYQRVLTHGGEDREVLERYKKLTTRVASHPGPAGRGLTV